VEKKNKTVTKQINILIQILPAFSDWMSYIQGCCKILTLYLKYTILKYTFKRLLIEKTVIIYSHLSFQTWMTFFIFEEHKRRYSE